MAAKDESAAGAADIFTEMLRIQGEAARQVLGTFLPEAAQALPEDRTITEWGEAAMRIQKMWEDFHAEQRTSHIRLPLFVDPAEWMTVMQGLYRQMPLLDPDRQRRIFEEGLQLWENILAQYEPGEGDSAGAPALPRSDKRFAAPEWRERPVFALIHQTYLLLAQRIAEAVDEVDGLDEQEREQLRFATRSVLDAVSPANFPMMNPLVLERTLETQGENLARGMERLAADLEKGQLTHTDSTVFRLGENIASTPGKVVHETELFQLIQYSPATEEVLETPLLIFPPWINRFYILDLNPKKSFVKWAVEQGLTVFMVSWRSADESLAHVTWDHYIRAQIEAIEVVRRRLGVPSVHTVGYCVAGTTLAATLAVLARRGQGDRVASATFLTAQVDFEQAGELKLFVDDRQMDLIRQASKGGFLDGRYMAATFNLLRGTDLIWNYVVNHYLLGEDYPAFDLLHWNGDVTNLPALWHEAYLRDLYRDNLLVQPDALEADGTRIDLGLVKTPVYVQAGREDHIAPPESVLRMLSHLSGPGRFVLAGSGHIAGVVNPPAAGKYQYWTGSSDAPSIAAFLEGAEEHPGSWWNDWIAWIAGHGGKRVPARGKRRPGGRGDRVIEDAPGRYVAMR
ncbi:class I poly(R)-hydroxyalkanoic acid synthase [Altererythrobacter sp. B11]|uniref:PHA/PHB synthase family protein n=1 Tax=Altererythrobacter sp. B11 TaxID=2060312 RepID=UPI000DC6DF23|nr:class I poly(R)-hydroxyalkanoic acid synthase [Altererythrobacter sp. B11]BBC72074.1 class I poly(R)-hydroxyalkanoic acid synthase [Altererythrobacter sp. B11]